MEQKLTIVIGAGIVGLSTARALSIKGFKVIVIDRSPKAVGASIRNFGMIWPIGQPAGDLYNRAKRSKEIWLTVAKESGIWYNESGSLHLAYNDEEWQVLQELENIFKAEGRKVDLLNAVAIADLYKSINTTNLRGGLYSKEEMLIDPREAIATLPNYLTEKYGVQFYWNKCVSFIIEKTAYIGKNEYYEADYIFVCSGTDFETLYPKLFSSLPITKCKLQMMRTSPIKDVCNVEVAVCAGLSLLHYNSFKAAPSLSKLYNKISNEMPVYLKWGIHVMIAQNGLGEITIGDSHEYGLEMQPFDRVEINKMIFDYLQTFLPINQHNIAETWNGFYPKLTDGSTELFLNPESGIYIINGLGGAGMTLSFGLTEEIIASIIKD